MASTKHTKRILNHGSKIITSASNKRARPKSESDTKTQNTDDDSQDEFLQQTTTDQSGKKDKRPKLLRPNAFLSFRITNQQVRLL
ncbi:unnamed protein product [Adineta steineri]|nr:unnamed protein product [Adineta steineri]